MKAGANHPMGPLTLADFVGLDTLVSIGNVMFDGTRIVGVLDWEMATIGDPLADVGYTLLWWGTNDRPPRDPQLAAGVEMLRERLRKAAPPAKRESEGGMR